MFSFRSVATKLARSVLSAVSPKPKAPTPTNSSSMADTLSPEPKSQEANGASKISTTVDNPSDNVSATSKQNGSKNQVQRNRVRAQTTKDRREYAKRKRQERSQEEPRERKPRTDTDEPRKPKRKVALLLGFCGTGFQGMQVNPNARTIEGELFKALVKAGAVSEENADDQSKVQFQRAARTDKGVHAAGQVVSLKMIIEDPEVLSKINEYLPEQIRAWGFVRVIRSFNSKTMCDSRIYEYLLPTYVLMDPSEANKEMARSLGFSERRVRESSAEDMAVKRAYRAPQERLQFVRDALAKYVGTHDFRNFTVTRGCTESNSKRFIHSFTASDPMIIRGGEWISLKVKGQSFMLHQIRKMVGLVVLMARAGAPLSLIDALFNGPRVNVPKAPGLGLLLEQPVFDSYNRKAASQRKDASSDLVTFEPYLKEIEGFKQKYIYDAIVDTEMADGVFDWWVQSTEVYPEPFTFVNTEGTIPDDAVVTPGREHAWQVQMREMHAAEKAKNQASESSDDEEQSAKED
ncbi:tRNA pseudouridine synthase 1 [Coemansia erecta]|uniref:tRNA pseudouridine synthase 1 n=1 Tax=Coemansia asiatica TaxID=1052880 RepID=A0A9W7XDU3_9FUNG|nr:tRNA pseudouridine synthase 1 [Coemansia asiatica]KAJ2858353.1 tRNA pseudouridine synthase 1 [Coemansia erecta]